MRKRGGFTLIELLVVVGMIVALAGLLLPALHQAYMAAQRAAISSDLQVIGNALEAYRGDFGDYPRPGGPSKYQPGGVLPVQSMTPSPAMVSGPQILCWALIAPGPVSEDGADGPGFRLRGATGRVYGPYLPPDRFVVGTLSSNNKDDLSRVTSYADTGTAPSDDAAVLADRRGRVILYYPAHRTAHPSSSPNSYVATFWRQPVTHPPDPPVYPPLGWIGQNLGPGGGIEGSVEPRWNVMDGPAAPMLIPPNLLKNMLGADANGGVSPGTAAADAPYLLISAGTAAAGPAWDPGMKQESAQGGSADPFGQPGNVANIPLVLPN